MKKLITLFLLALLPLMVSAQVQINGIFYNLNTTTKQAEVTLGNFRYAGTVNIPEKVTYGGVIYNVTSIGNGGFSYCSDLTSVTIPNSITSIGGSAFRSCTSLTSIIIPNSVTSIGRWAFEQCTALISLKIGNGLTSIGEDAFDNCSSLTSVTINSNAIVSKDYSDGNSFASIFGSQVKEYILGEDVKSIGREVFYNCLDMTSVTIPNSVTGIGSGSFLGCSSLTSVTVPNSVTSISDRAFRSCTSLKEVTIPNSVTWLGDYAFDGCSGLTSVTIPSSVTIIGKEAFNFCPVLTSVTINSNAIVSKDYSDGNGFASFFDYQVKEYILGESVTSIGCNVFSRCYNMTSVTIPSSVTSIGDLAFAKCSGIKDIYCYAEKAPSTGADSFYDVQIEKVTLHVPYGTTKTYKASAPWSGFGRIIPIGVEPIYIETDVTSQFPTDWQGWNGATGYTATQFAPMVTTNDGRRVQVCEKFNGSNAATGTVFYRTLTGLTNGTYRIELYGAASSTKGRDTNISSDMTADDEGDETAVYLYAKTPWGTVKQYIPVHWATSFSEIATAVLDGVEVTNGTVEIGMYSDKYYTNWHVVQIKGVTALVDAEEGYIDVLETAETALADGLYANVAGGERSALEQAVSQYGTISERKAETYQTAINALVSATATFTNAKEAYDAFVAAKSTVADRSFPYSSAEKKSAAESSVAASASSAADAESKATAMLTNFRQYAESSAMLEGVNGSIDMTSYIKNPKAESAIVSSEWQTVLGANSGGSINILDNQPWTDGGGNTTHKYFDGGDWGSSAWDVTFQQEITLSAGKYQLTAIGRSSKDVNLTLFAGNNTVEMSHIGAAGGLFNLGWEQNSVEFELADAGTVKIGVRGVTSVQHNWMSFSDFRLVKFPDATVETVIAKIDAIGTVEFTDACKALINAARAAYNALTDEQKALVNAEKLKVLTDAEAEYETMKKAAEDQAAAAAVIAKIDAIGTVEFTDACKALIDAARAAYNALTDEQKALVNAEKLKVLTDAEAEYETMKKAAEDQAAAAAVIAKIDAIGTVDFSDACKALIDAARVAYDALTDAQKALVTNYDVLTGAEQAYADLTKAFAVLTYKVGEQSSTRMTVKKGNVLLDIAVEECWTVETLTVNGTNKKDDFVDGKLTVSVDADTEVSVTFGWADIDNLYTEDVATGIATIEGENVKVYVNDGQICVDGAAGKLVRLYTVGGQFIMSVTPSEGMTGKFSVPSGTYIVQVGSKAARVLVK